MNLFTRFRAKSTIAAIHNEFNTASDRLLKEAQQIANQTDPKLIDKGKRLASLGFHETHEVKLSAQHKRRKDENAEHVKWANYYHQHYPFNRFIVEEQIKAICEKYGLIHGPVGNYIGFVPEKNLREIENFKLRDEDVPYVLRGWGRGMFFASEPIDEIVDKKTWEEYQPDEYSNGRKWRGIPLNICAPAKDFDKRGMMIRGFKLMSVPDPVVLQPVLGGSLILSAWGLEASDENVVNKINN